MVVYVIKLLSDHVGLLTVTLIENFITEKKLHIMAWIHILFDPRDFELPIKQIMMIGSREA